VFLRPTSLTNIFIISKGILLDVLIWFERRYEIYTPKSVGCVGVPMLGLSV